MRSRLSQPAQSGDGTLSFNVPNGNQNLVLADKTLYNKLEVEYAYRVFFPDRYLSGRMTLVYNGVGLQVVSDEEELPSGQARPNVNIVPYENGNDIGITIQNNEAIFDLQYKIVNKFKV